MKVQRTFVRTYDFACHSKACAPPPAGAGGSKPGNTSVVSADRNRKVAASDDHPEAPGARNLAAVRGYRGETGVEPERRIPRAGETVDLYRDLGRGREHRRGYPDHDAFSVRLASGKDGNSTALVTASTVGVVLSNGRPSWAMAAKRKAEEEGKRGVHAFVRGEVERYVSPAVGAAMVKRPGWEKVTYYPGTQDFFRPSDRARWTGADKVVLVKGEFFAKNARFDSSSPTPVSPIEKRMGLAASAHEFACHSKACAPPPVGSGGSSGEGKTRPVITAAEARGDSRPVSHAEFQRLAATGAAQMRSMAKRSSPTTGLDQNWDKIKRDTYEEVKKDWGGATIDAHTGKPLPSKMDTDAYALTVKGARTKSVSIPENATAAEFNAAMDTARRRFGKILERENHYLGVFHDNDTGRIDIDPVVVVRSRADVDTIGAASRAIGGAYNFKDGNGYWPPHVAEGG